MLGGAVFTEGGTFVWLDLALQHEPAETFGRFFDAQTDDTKLALGIISGVGVGQAQAALGNFTDAAPLAGHDLKDFPDELLGGTIAGLAPGAAVDLEELREQNRR